MTASAETVIHGSKSTDFIKPKGSSTNLEAQNPGTFPKPTIAFLISKVRVRFRIGRGIATSIRGIFSIFIHFDSCRWFQSVHKTLVSSGDIHSVFSIECTAMDSIQHHCECRREVSSPTHHPQQSRSQRNSNVRFPIFMNGDVSNRRKRTVTFDANSIY